MRNKEFYEDELKEIMVRNIGINAITGKPKICDELFCLDCVFKDRDACNPQKVEQWLQSEHVDLVDWSKVKVDTPIYVRINENSPWLPRHFARYENGKVYVWRGGSTSFTESEDVSWNYAKLAKSEED